MSKSERRGRKTVEKQAESLDESLGAGCRETAWM